MPEILPQSIESRDKKREKSPNDPRLNAENQRQWQNIINDQFRYFKLYGQPHTVLKARLGVQEIRLDDNTVLHVPDTARYEFDREREDAESGDYEAELQRELDGLNSVLRTIAGELGPVLRHLHLINNEELGLVSSVAGEPVCSSLAGGNGIHEALRQINALKKFLELLKTKENDFQTMQGNAAEMIKQEVRAAFAGNRNLNEAETEKIINEADILCREPVVFADAETKKAVERLRESEASANAARAACDIAGAKFLTYEDETPPYFSLWLSATLAELQKIKWDEINDWAREVKKRLADYVENESGLRNRVFQAINKEIQIKVDEKEAGKEAPILLKSERKSKPPSETQWLLAYYIALKKELEGKYRSQASGEIARKLREAEKRIGELSGRKQKAEKGAREESEKLERLESRQAAAEPAMKLSERTQPRSSLREIDAGRWEGKTKGRIETFTRELFEGALFVTRRATLGKTSYAPIDSAPETRDFPVFSGEEPSAEQSIIHLPCSGGGRVSLPIPLNYELKTIGWSKADYPADSLQIKPVNVEFHRGEGIHTFVNPLGEGWIHYVIARKNKPDVMVEEERRKNLETFPTQFDDPEIEKIAAFARKEPNIEQRAEIIRRELQKKNFLYGWGSNALDELYHEKGRDRFYALLETVQIGACQQFSLMAAHIFRKSGIPAQVIEGEVARHYGFQAIGHARVLYADEAGLLKEFEATSLARNLIRRLKPADKIDQQAFDRLANAITQTENREDFQKFCREMRELVTEELPDLERKVARLDAFQKEFAEAAGRGIRKMDDILGIFQLGLDYLGDVFSFFDFRDPEMKERYGRYRNISPWNMCMKYIFAFLEKAIIQELMTAADLIEIADKLIDRALERITAQSESLHVLIASAAFDTLRKTGGNLAPAADFPGFLRALGKAPGIMFSFGNAKDDLRIFEPLFERAFGAKDTRTAGAILQSFFCFACYYLPTASDVFVTKEKSENQKTLADYIRRGPEIKELILRPDLYDESITSGATHAHIVENDLESRSYEILSTMQNG